MQERILLSIREQKYAATNHVIPELHFILRERIDPGTLEKAVRGALEIHPVFRQKIVREEGGLYYFETNGLPPVPAPFVPDKKIYYGTEEYHSYPWQIFYAERDVFITGSHAVSDGTGYTHFMRTVLHFYFELHGHVFSGEAAETDLTPAREPAFDPFSAAAEEHCRPCGAPSFPACGRLPEELFETDLTRLKMHRILLKKQDAAERAGTWETSLFSVIACYAAMAVRKLTQAAEGRITVRVPVDLRQTFPVETDRDFSMGFPLSYDIKRMQDKPASFAASVFRSQLDLMSDRDNLIRKMQSEQGRMERLREHPEVLDTLPESFCAYRRRPDAEVTFTHISKTGFSAELEALTEAFYMEAGPMPERSVVIFATTLRDDITLFAYETLKENAFARALEEILREEGVPFKSEAVLQHVRAEHIAEQF